MKSINYALFISILITLFSFQAKAQLDTNDFVTTWRTYNLGPAGDSSIAIGVDPNYTYNYDVDWDNDGIFDSLGMTTTVLHTYPDTGTYTIRIRGLFPRFSHEPLQGEFRWFGGLNNKLIGLNQWGNNPWQWLLFTFANLDSMFYYATDAPNLSQITNLDRTFDHCQNFDGDLSNWDVSTIVNFCNVFSNTNFNHDISNWDVSSAKYISCMFTNTPFNQPLNSWDVSNVENTFAMFANTPFNQPLDNWDVSNVTNMIVMFENTPFNQPLNNWNVSNVTSMLGMFRNNKAFNQPLNNWDVSKVTNLGNLFEGTNFNQPINNWKVDSAQNMSRMFQNNKAFNQPLNNWNTDSLKGADNMFSGATSFDQNISNFDFSNVSKPLHSFSLSITGMLDSCGMSFSNYDSLLIKLASYTNIDSIPFGAYGLAYCNADSSRTALINRGWIITGDSLNCSTVGVAAKKEARVSSEFKIYPNPAKEFFMLESENYTENNLVRVYSLDGKLIKELFKSKNNIQVSTFYLQNGIYLVQYNGVTERLIINK